jgi:hypothetical protein
MRFEDFDFAIRGLIWMLIYCLDTIIQYIDQKFTKTLKVVTIGV